MDRIVFAFPDGVLDYNCSECTALCCKGFGTAFGASRDARVFKLYPELATLAVAQSGDCIKLLTPGSGCPELLPSGLCAIELKHGKSFKPVVCTLFPFNALYYLGDSVIVAPHRICPLRMQIPPRPGHVTGTHQTIVETLRDLHILDKTKIHSWVIDLNKEVTDPPAEVLEREITFRHRCDRALGTERARDVVLESSADAATLLETEKRVRHLLKWNASSPPVRDIVDDAVLTLASVIRLTTLNHSVETQLAAILLFEGMVRETLGSVEAPPTFFGIHSLLEPSLTVIGLLSFGDTRVKPRHKNLPSTTPPKLTLAAAWAMSRFQSDGVLKALEGACRLVPSAVDRTLIVRQLSHLPYEVVATPSSRRPRR